MATGTLGSSTEDRDFNWYHGSLSRELAEITLRKDGSGGSFLVRESTSSPGDYVLSVLWADKIHHIQILRHENDAFFSIDQDHQNVIHGLDELIKFYLKEGELVVGTQHIPLHKPLVGLPPPADCKRHGRVNLLHRVAAVTDTKDSVAVVRSMVTSSYRSLEAKNDDGQTAVHIAAYHGNNEVLQILIGAKCNVNAKDSRSCTPLHYASLMNHPETIEILMNPSIGNAIPWIRRDDEYQDWVPLHEAAARGNLDCVRILLCKYHVALRPRTFDDRLPLDLAKESNHEETAQFLENYFPPEPQTSREDWYHDSISRGEAHHRLEKTQEEYDDPSRGFFLIRYSEKQRADVLTVLYLRSQPNLTNYPILKKGKYFHFDNGPYFDSMAELVEHYARWADGLPTTLQVAVSPAKFVRSPGPLLRPPPLPKRTPRSSPNNGFATQFINNNAHTFSKDNIPSEWIVLGRALGEGEFGFVNEAELRVPGERSVPVAVKRLNQDLNEYAREEFIREANLMLNLDHEHIVKLIGFSWDGETYMIQELMSLGSLRDYLVEHQDEISVDGDIRLWAHQIAKGMCYLQNQKLVHRDLAARNILLARRDLAKISDFGLSRCLGSDQDYYTASKGGRWPVKWYAPESTTRATFTHASDVWSFGVTIWEMYSFGETPFPDLEGREVVELILEGRRLEKPDGCPSHGYDVMLQCWEEDPKNRITFQELVVYFGSSEV